MAEDVTTVVLSDWEDVRTYQALQLLKFIQFHPPANLEPHHVPCSCQYSTINSPVTSPSATSLPTPIISSFSSQSAFSNYLLTVTAISPLSDEAYSISTQSATTAAAATTTSSLPDAYSAQPLLDQGILQLPPFTPMCNPFFTCGTQCAEDFSNALEATYSEVVHWRRNIFAVPYGKVGREFVGELS